MNPKYRDEAYHLAGIGHWEIELESDDLYWSDEIKILHDVPLDYQPTVEDAIAFYEKGECRQSVQSAVERAIENGESYVIESKIITAKGNERWVKSIGEPVFENGECIRLYGSTQDITAHKKRQQEIKKQQKKLNLLSRVASETQNMVIITDPHERIEWVNEAFTRVTGYTKQEVLGKNPGMLLQGPETDQKTVRRIAFKIEAGKPFSEEILNYTKAGNPYWLKMDVSPITDDKGNITQFFSIQEDITEQKQTEQKLKESLNRYHYATKATNEVIYDWNIKDDQLHFGEAFRELVGPDLDFNRLSLEEYTQYVHPDDSAEAQQSRDRTLADPSRSHWEHEYRFKKATGQYAQIIENAYIIRNEKGAAVRMIGALRDVTEERELKQLLDEAYQMAGIGAWEVDLRDDKIHWSPVTKKLHEVHQDFEPDLKTAINFYAPGESRKRIKNLLNKAIEKGISWDEELQIVTGKGRKKWVRTKAKPEFSEGTCRRIYGIFQDIHERKQAQIKKVEVLKEQERILDRITEGFFAVDKDWTVTYWNTVAEEIIGIKRSEMLDENLWGKFPEAKGLSFFQQFKRAFEEQKNISFEDFYPPLDIWLEVNIYPSKDGLSAFFKDITDRKIQERKINDSLKEKETLLMEIHHRVKNNLAVISGLMQLQAYKSNDETLRQKLDDSVSRIKTMASIHELLYSSDSFSKLNAGEIIQKLISDIIQGFGSETLLNTKFEMQTIDLNINQAIPLSLIINEVVTNILKHAFTEADTGTLAVFISEKNKLVRLRITDDGKGLPKGFPDVKNTNTLGLELIETLSQQLKADYIYETVNGETHFILTFEKTDLKGIGNAL